MQMQFTNTVLGASYTIIYMYLYKPLHESGCGLHGNALLLELFEL